VYYRGQALFLIPVDETHIYGGQIIQQLSVAADYDLDDDDYLVGVDTTGGALFVEMQTAQLAAGRAFWIFDEGGNAAVANITIQTEGAETVNGAASVVINTAYGAAFVYSDGTNWFAALI
jgi:hypothetical protein